MTTKLTLTIDDEVISSAKKYAKHKGKSLSDIVENYLMALSTDESGEEQIAPRILTLMGSVQLPEDFIYEEELTKALTKKFKT